MGKTSNNISEVIAPMIAITMELDAIIGASLKEKFKMSLADFKVLRAIHMLDVCTQLDIARFNHVTEAAVSKRIKSLSDDGLVEKSSDPDDKRMSVLTLTTEGKVLMKKIQTEVISNTESMLIGFTKVSRKLTRELLTEILGMIIEHSPRKEMLLKSKHPVLNMIKECKVNQE